MLLNVTTEEATLLARVLSEYRSRGGSTVPDVVPQQPLSIALVRTRGGWAEGRKGTGSGESGLCVAESLIPGTANDDDPHQNTGNRFPLSAIIAPRTIVVAASLRNRIVRDSSIRLIGMEVGYDNGLYHVELVTPMPSTGTPTTLELRLDRNLYSSNVNVGTRIVLNGSWGWKPAERVLTAVTHSRHDVGLAARIGPEFMLLDRPRCRGILATDLAQASVNGSGTIVPSEAILIPGEFHPSTGQFLAVLDPETFRRVELTVWNLDEFLIVPAHTFVYADLWGDHWELDYAACNVSGTPINGWSRST